MGGGGKSAHSAVVPKPPFFTGGQNKPESIQRVQDLVGKEIPFQELDVLDEQGLQELFKKVRSLTVAVSGGPGVTET